MARKIAEVRVRCTKEELQAAMQAHADDVAAVMFFLIGAEREQMMLQGRTAGAVLKAACRLLHISDQQLAILSEVEL